MLQEASPYQWVNAYRKRQCEPQDHPRIPHTATYSGWYTQSHPPCHVADNHLESDGKRLYVEEKQ